MKGCRRARQRIFREVDKSLSLEERFLLDEHLLLCHECEELYERMLGLEEALVRMSEPSEEGLNVESAVAAIRRSIDAGGATSPARSAPWPRIAAVAAATLALAALGAWLLRGDAGSAVARVDEAAELVQSPRTHAPGEGGESVEPAEPDAEAVIDAVRASLLACVEEGWDATSSPAAELVTRFEARSRPLLLWPLPRIAEKLLADPDPRVACAAARYLGLRGDRISVFRLEETLSRGDVAAAVVQALGDLGPRGVSVLAQALRDPDRAAVVLVELKRIGGPEAAAALEHALLEPTTSSAEPEALLDALAATGPAAVKPLIRLAQSDRVADVAPLAWLQQVEGGADELVRLLRAWNGRQPIEVLLEAVAVLQQGDAHSVSLRAGSSGSTAARLWVEERIQEFRYRKIALQSLVTWEGTAPVESLLRLDAEGRVPDEDLLWALEALGGRDAQRLTEYARELLLAGDAITAGRYLELLLVSGDVRLAPALGPFVKSDLLSDGERQLAALAIGELGAEEDALLLLRAMEHLGRSDSGDERLYAACLITVHRVLGEPGVSEAMAGLSPGAARQVQTALRGVEDGAAGAIGLSRVARALNGALTKTPKNRNPIL